MDFLLYAFYKTCANRSKKVLFVARLKRAYITKMQSYPIYMLASIVFLVNGLLGANNGFQSDMYTSSGELINAFRMEQELVRSLKDIQLQNSDHLIFIWVIFLRSITIS